MMGTGYYCVEERYSNTAPRNNINASFSSWEVVLMFLLFLSGPLLYTFDYKRGKATLEIEVSFFYVIY